MGIFSNDKTKEINKEIEELSKTEGNEEKIASLKEELKDIEESKLSDEDKETNKDKARIKDLEVKLEKANRTSNPAMEKVATVRMIPAIKTQLNKKKKGN